MNANRPAAHRGVMVALALCVLAGCRGRGERLARCLDSRLESAERWGRVAASVRQMRLGAGRALLPASITVSGVERIGRARPVDAISLARDFQTPPAVALEGVDAAKGSSEAMWTACRASCEDLGCSGTAPGLTPRTIASFVSAARAARRPAPPTRTPTPTRAPAPNTELE